MLNCAYPCSTSDKSDRLTSPRLSVVPDRQDRLSRTDETARQSADRGVPDDLRHPEQRCGGDDGAKRQCEGEGETGQYRTSSYRPISWWLSVICATLMAEISP